MNVLKPHLQTTIWTLLRSGSSQREIARVTGVSRHTIRAYQKQFAEQPEKADQVATDSAQTAPPWPPTPLAAPTRATAAVSLSSCEPHRAFIEAQLKLKRNAMAI